MTIRKRLDSAVIPHLPQYLSGRLARPVRWLVERWISRSPDTSAALRNMAAVRTSLHSLPAANPKTADWLRLQAAARRMTVSGPSAALRTGLWTVGMALAAVLLAAVWFALPPANILTWSVDGPGAAEFHVYRGDLSGAEAKFVLIDVVSADAAADTYRLVDYRLYPGKEYVYRVDALSPDGRALTSGHINGSGIYTLPGQIALLLALAVSLYGLSTLAGALRWRQAFPLQTAS